MRKIMIFIIIVVVTLFVSCSIPPNNNTPTSGVQQAVSPSKSEPAALTPEKVVEKMINAANSSDPTAFLECWDPASAKYRGVQNMIKTIPPLNMSKMYFALGISSELDHLITTSTKIISMDDANAEVSADYEVWGRQQTKTGAMTLHYTLIKKEGTWYITEYSVEGL